MKAHLVLQFKLFEEEASLFYVLAFFDNELVLIILHSP